VYLVHEDSEVEIGMAVVIRGERHVEGASTEIVAIGQDMDEQRLNNLFDSCKT
jgi:hypothetical protein